MKDLLVLFILGFLAYIIYREEQAKQAQEYSHPAPSKFVRLDTIIKGDERMCGLDSLLTEDTCIGLKSIGVNIDRGDAKLSPKAYAEYDTMPKVVWVGYCKIFYGDTYEDYKKLSERGKHIVDSLQDAGLPQLSQSYLAYEPHYMKAGKKKEWFWSIEYEDVVVYEYVFYRNDKSNGFNLLNEITIK
jgi:hypothetical protein